MSLSNAQSHEDRAQAQVLVTGASGFIGSPVVRQLLQAGYNVEAITRSAGNRPIAQPSGQTPGTLQVINLDLLHHRKVHEVINAIRPTACIHAAWDVCGGDYRHRATNQAWVHASLNLFQALRANDCRWLGVVGSCIEAKPREAPTCRYSAAKTTLRHRMFELGQAQSGTKVCWWQLFQPYGAGEHPQRLVPSLISAMQKRERFTVLAPHDVRDFIHVEDVAHAMVCSLGAGATGAFELGTGSGCSIADFAQLAVRLAKAPSELVCLDSMKRVATSLIANPARLMQVTGWRARFNLETGLRQLLMPEVRTRAVA